MGATVDLGFAVCDRLVSDFYVYLSVVFSTCIIGGFVYWFGCSQFYYYFFILIIVIFLKIN